MKMLTKTILLSLSLALLSNSSVFSASIYYGMQAGAYDGVYKVDMATGNVVKIYSGLLTQGIQPFGSDRIVVTDYSQHMVNIINTDGSIYKQFITKERPHFAIQDPDSPQTLIYSSHVSNQVRTINTNTGAEALLASYSYANKIVVKPDGVPYITLWTPGSGGVIYNLDTGALVKNTDWISAIVCDNAGNFYFTGHSAWSTNVIYKLDVDNNLTTFYSGSVYLSGITYDSANNRLMTLADEGAVAKFAIYSFDLNSNGTMSKLLTGVDLPHHIDPFSGGYAYTLYLNDQSFNAVPEPATLCLFLVSVFGLAKRLFHKK